MGKFEIGKTYSTRSICDSNCFFTFTIVSRTEKTVTIIGKGENMKVKRGITIYENEEQIFPLGKYSMAPALGASDKID